MGKSDIMMGADDIAAMESELAPDTSTPSGPGPNEPLGPVEPDRTPVKKAKAEPPLEFVAPDEGEASEEGGEAKPKKDAAKGKEKPAETDKKAASDEVHGNLQKALQEERKRRQERDRELEAERLKYASERARLEERLTLINDALSRRAQPQPQQPVDNDPVPDSKADPIAFMEWQGRQIQRMQQERAEERRQAQERDAQQQRLTTEQQAERRLVDQTRVNFTAAAQADPAINQAYNYLRNSRIRELQAMGYQPTEIQQALNAEELSLVKHSAARGKHYHDTILEMASARAWARAAAEQGQTAQNGHANGNGQARDPATGQFLPQKQEDNADKLEKLAKTVAASDTLSGSGGSAPGSIRLSLESLDRMDQKELTALIKRVEREGGQGAWDRALAKMQGVPAR